MKKLAAAFLFFCLATLLLPLGAAALARSGGPGAFLAGLPVGPAGLGGSSGQGSPAGTGAAGGQGGGGQATPAPAAWNVTLPILDTATGQVETVSMRDFLIGAAASEMPISYQPEAFKAQIVAAYSYALANRDAQLANPDPALAGAWFSADPGQYQGYIRPQGLRALWGEQYQHNYEYISGLVDEVGGQLLTFEGAAALATYYALSNGVTRSSEAVWGTALPYLVPVDSPLDLTSPDCEQTLELSAQEMADRLNLAFLALDLSGPLEGWFEEPQRDAGGYVTSVRVGGQTLKGTELRAALGLRSADFTLQVEGGSRFLVTTRGYGHGVGLSQYGANAMAITGKSYAEILAHYYPGTVLAGA